VLSSIGSTACPARWRVTSRALPEGVPVAPAVDDVRWMIEELRVGMFAQQLGTRFPVSEKRVRRALEDAVQRTA
jgi:hypothetical protein